MSTDASGDPAEKPKASDSIAMRLSKRSDQIRDRVDTIRPDNTDRLERWFKIAFSATLTILLVYWVLAYQFDVVWFEF